MPKLRPIIYASVLSLWIAEAQTYLSKCKSQKRSIYSNRTVSCVNVLLELLTVLLEYIDLSVIAILISRNSYYYTNILPIMLALCSMLSGTYYAHNYASIIGGSLSLTVGIFTSYYYTVFGHYVLLYTPIQLISLFFIALLHCSYCSLNLLITSLNIFFVNS